MFFKSYSLCIYLFIFDVFMFLFFSPIIFISWRLITLQYFQGEILKTKIY